jgi:Kef-type K+ transport system membrane component KefB
MQSQLSRHGLEIEATSVWEPFVQTTVSMVFMVLVGLSMPALIGNNAGDNDTDMGAGLIVLHVLAVSLLMVLGKMFPCVCYRDEAPIIHRLALCLGMCPRGEVGASIIVISLELGVQGPAITISMCALVINLVFSGGFIGLVKLLLAGSTSAS